MGCVRQILGTSSPWQAITIETNLTVADPDIIPASFYLFKVSNGNTRTMREIYPKLTMKTTDIIAQKKLLGQNSIARKIPSKINQLINN